MGALQIFGGVLGIDAAGLGCGGSWFVIQNSSTAVFSFRSREACGFGNGGGRASGDPRLPLLNLET
jgi:hypothetical protein